MFAFGDISKYKGEKGSCKILKPVWDVVTDYLVISLAMLSILFAGMEVTSGSFECLAAVDCPGMSRPNMSIFLSHSMNRNACKAFYRSQKTNVIKKTVVVTDIKSNIQYANFVNSECSKSAIANFLAYFWLVLFTQAFVLVVLDNLWLKLPITASAIENFVELVMACYASPIPNFALTKALSDIPATRRQEFGYKPVDQQQNNEIEIENSDDFDNDESYEHDVLEDPATVSAIKTLCEKVVGLKKDIKSSRKFIKIWRLYLLQSVLQAILTFAFIIIDCYFMKDLQGTMTCTVTQYIPVPHDYFICSHGLAPAFVGGLYIYLIILGLCLVFFMGIIAWMVKIIFKCRCASGKKCKSRCEYMFQENELPGTKLADIRKEDGDFGFLLHLLHHYNHVYVNRLAYFLSKRNKEKIETFVTKSYPVSELRKQLDYSQKITFSKLRAIPQTIFQLPKKIVELELIECRPLENEDFDNFGKFTSLRTLSIIKCGLKCIPDGILKMEWLESLNLKGNHITSIDCDLSNLKNLIRIDLSDNGLKTVTSNFGNLVRLSSLNLSGNPEFTVQSLDIVLACPELRNLDSPPHLFQKVHELNSLKQRNFFEYVSRFISEEIFVVPYTPENAPHIDKDDTDKIYKMDSRPKGVAIIFNNLSYKEARYSGHKGSERNAHVLQSLFEQIGFDTVCCTDYKAEQAKQFLEECAKDEKYKDCDCIAVFVLSHGREGGIIFPDDEVVPVKGLVKCVQKSSLYEEKPKLFFIQAGWEDLKPGSHSNVADRSTAASVPSQSTKEASKARVMTGFDMHVPKGADILLSYSTMQGSVSEGSYWQRLTDIFCQHANEEDVLNLLTLVNYEIVSASTTSRWRQLPAPQSTLRKKLYFLPGYPYQRSNIKPPQESTTSSGVASKKMLVMP